MELMETSTTNHWAPRNSCRFTMPTKSSCHTCVFSSCPWRGLPRLQLSSISCHCPPKCFPPESTPCHLRVPNPGSLIRIWWLLVGTRQSGVWKLTWGMADKLWEKEGMEKERKEKVYSESCWWNLSQLITHKTDSLLTLLCSLIFHIILFTAPSACSTKVKWREW